MKLEQMAPRGLNLSHLCLCKMIEGFGKCNGDWLAVHLVAFAQICSTHTIFFFPLKDYFCTPFAKDDRLLQFERLLWQCCILEHVCRLFS